MKKKELEQKSRKVFHDLHKVQSEIDTIFNRLQALLDEEYLKVEKDFFHDKICLDAGCGSNANATYALLRMGAKKVHCFDLDSSIKEIIPKMLDKEFKGKYELNIDNILHMNYENEMFDFVHCSGVLHHTFDAFKGLKELARVTKKGGMLFFTINGKGGIIRDTTSFLRERYKTDQSFKLLIDTLSPSFFLELVDFVSNSMKQHGQECNANPIKKLFDKDMILTIKDRIQAPTYDEFTEEELVEWLKINGFSKIERLTRYPKFNNIRKFLSPFYFNYKNKFSRLLYGEGIIQIKAKKL